MPDTMLLAIGGVILGLMIFTMGYGLLTNSILQSQRQSFLNQVNTINAEIETVCQNEPGNSHQMNLIIPNQVRVFYTTDSPDEVLPTVTDLINGNNLGEGNYLCFQFKSEQFNRCSKMRCRTKLPYMGALEDYNDFQIAVNKILGRPLMKEYEVRFTRTINGININFNR